MYAGCLWPSYSLEFSCYCPILLHVCLLILFVMSPSVCSFLHLLLCPVPLSVHLLIPSHLYYIFLPPLPSSTTLSFFPWTDLPRNTCSAWLAGGDGAHFTASLGTIRCHRAQLSASRRGVGGRRAKGIKFRFIHPG